MSPVEYAVETIARLFDALEAGRSGSSSDARPEADGGRRMKFLASLFQPATEPRPELHPVALPVFRPVEPTLQIRYVPPAVNRAHRRRLGIRAKRAKEG